MIKYHPILFSTPMVQGILEDRKTKTRRLRGLEKINSDPDDWQFEWMDYALKEPWRFTKKSSVNPTSLKNRDFIQEALKCPYGQVGDVLWVKEMYYAYGYWVKDGLTKKTRKQKWKFVDLTTDSDFSYRYFEDRPVRLKKNSYRNHGWYKRSSLFMPKAACRIFLEITDVKIERLQDISEEDARKEGVEFRPNATCGPNLQPGYRKYRKGFHPDIGSYIHAKESFQSLWKFINGIESWEANPFVWVISFKKINKPENFK